MRVNPHASRTTQRQAQGNPTAGASVPEFRTTSIYMFMYLLVHVCNYMHLRGLARLCIIVLWFWA